MIEQFPVRWRAHFQDGSVLSQFDDDGTQHTYLGELAHRLDVVAIEVLGLDRPIRIPLPPGARPIIYYKNLLEIGGRLRRTRWSVFGYESATTKPLLVYNHSTRRLAWVNGDGDVLKV